jgi:rhomboid family GlyGly-CTERM serine protease
MRGRWSFDFPWTLGLAVLAVLATAAHLQGGPLGRSLSEPVLGLAGRIRDGELWRLATGALVHGSGGHLARDIAVLLGLGLVYEGQLGRRWPWLLVAGLIVPSAVLVLSESRFHAFFGLSGATYTLIAGALVHEFRAAGRPSWPLLAFAAIAALKLVHEGLSGELLFPLDLGEGNRPAPLGHLIGAMAGLLVALPQRPGSRRGGTGDVPVAEPALH